MVSGHFQTMLVVTEKQRERFWGRVDKSGECWVWTGPTFTDGYGATTAGTPARSRRAHRVSWLLATGTDPGDKCVCHTCDNRLCVRPDHLWLGTNDDNMADMVAKGRASKGESPAWQDAQAKLLRGDSNPMRRHPERSHFAKVKFSFAGEANASAKLTAEQVEEIRARYVPRKVGLPQLAKEYGVGTSTIHRIVRGTHWRGVGTAPGTAAPVPGVEG